MTRTRTTMIGLAVVVGLHTGACSIDLGFDDFDLGPVEGDRVGDKGQLLFESEGCSSSQLIPIGGTATVTVEPASGDSLPPELSVETSSPSAIDATLDGDRITLTARARGMSYLTVLSEGEPHDGLGWFAVPATGVEYEAPERVLAGGRLELVVTEVFGCGLDFCPLFGHSFIDWQSEPAGALPVIEDDEGRAYFRGESSGRLLGVEPAEGAVLIDDAVEVVPPSAIQGWQASMIEIQLGEVAMPEMTAGTLPASVPQGTGFCLRLEGLRDGGAPVGVSPADVTWTVGGSALQPVPEFGDFPFCDVYMTSGLGTATLQASSPLFAEQPSFQVTVE